MKTRIFLIVFFLGLFISCNAVQAKAQQNQTSSKNAVNENITTEQLIELRNVIQTVDIKGNFALLSTAIKYHNGEVTLTEDEILEIKEKSMQQIGDILEQINYLIGKYGYPAEAFERLEIILPKQLVGFTKTAIEVSQLSLSTEEKINVLFETYASSCSQFLLIFSYSFIAGVIGIIYGIINAAIGMGNPGLALFLLIFPGIVIYSVAVLGIILFLTILGLSPILLILCLLGAI